METQNGAARELLESFDIRSRSLPSPLTVESSDEEAHELEKTVSTRRHLDNWIQASEDLLISTHTFYVYHSPQLAALCFHSSHCSLLNSASFAPQWAQSTSSRRTVAEVIARLLRSETPRQAPFPTDTGRYWRRTLFGQNTYPWIGPDGHLPPTTLTAPSSTAWCVHSCVVL